MQNIKENKIDIKENQLLRLDKELLEILLKDRTTGKNILWATDSYASHKPTSEININDITGDNTRVIQPRISKTKEEQKRRGPSR